MREWSKQQGAPRILTEAKYYWTVDMSVVAVIILCIQKDFHSGILKLFERRFHQGSKLHIIYFNLTDKTWGLW